MFVKNLISQWPIIGTKQACLYIIEDIWLYTILLEIAKYLNSINPYFKFFYEKEWTSTRKIASLQRLKVTVLLKKCIVNDIPIKVANLVVQIYYTLIDCIQWVWFWCGLWRSFVLKLFMFLVLLTAYFRHLSDTYITFCPHTLSEWKNGNIVCFENNVSYIIDDF